MMTGSSSRPYASNSGTQIPLESLRIQAANDWDRQQELNKELLSAYQRLLTEQREADAAEVAATRKRVLIELLGLALVAIGTALPDVANAVLNLLS